MIQKYTCQNGVRIVLEQIPHVRSAAIGIWVGVGSRDETPENNGISHFLEHMFFKGTKTRNAREIAEAFDSIGGQVNAFTSKEYTCYYAKTLDNHVSYALDILQDMFFHSTFDPYELNKEKNVVIEEIKMYEDAPDDTVHDLLSEAVYDQHALGYPILGTEKTINQFNQEQLNQYVEDMYTPDKIVISVAGNVEESIIKEIEQYFGSFVREKNNDQSLVPTFHSEKRFKQKDTEQAHLCLGFNGLPVGHDHIYDLIVMNNIFGGSMSSRLFQEVREEKGLAYSVYSFHSSYRDSGLVTIYGGTGVEQLDALYETIHSTLNNLKADGVTEKELNNSKEQLKGNLMLGLESTNSRMSRNGRNELLLGTHRSLDEIVKEIDAVNIERTNHMIQSVFSTEYSTAVISPKNLKA